MDIDQLTRRMKKLQESFDPQNPEDVAEMKAVWEELRPTFEAFHQWVEQHDIHAPHTVRAESICKN